MSQISSSLASLSSEQQFLIELVNADADSHGRVTATANRENLDWEYIVKTAVKHGVAPFLYRKAKHLCSDKEILQQLNTFYLSNLQRNMALTNELVGILSLFEAQGIAVVPFKGPVLAQQLYNDIGLRQSADLDLLIEKEAYRSIKELLVKQGYEPMHHLSNRQELAFLKDQCEMPFFHWGRGMNIEIHWDLAPKRYHFDLCSRGLWERLQPVGFAGKTIQTLSLEDLLLFLCFHGSKHKWERLSWIYDIHTILAAFPLDWEYILSMSQELGSIRTLLLGLWLTNQLWGSGLPLAINKEIAEDPSVSSLAADVLQYLFTEDEMGVYKASAFQLRLLKKKQP